VGELDLHLAGGSRAPNRILHLSLPPPLGCARLVGGKAVASKEHPASADRPGCWSRVTGTSIAPSSGLGVPTPTQLLLGRVVTQPDLPASPLGCPEGLEFYTPTADRLAAAWAHG